jgi:hypothetical protein
VLYRDDRQVKLLHVHLWDPSTTGASTIPEHTAVTARPLRDAAADMALVRPIEDEAVPMRDDIAEAIGQHLNLPVTSVPAAEAEGHFGWFAPFASLDSPASSELTRKRFDWMPERPGLIADLDAGHYFAN